MDNMIKLYNNLLSLAEEWKSESLKSAKGNRIDELHILNEYNIITSRIRLNINNRTLRFLRSQSPAFKVSAGSKLAVERPDADKSILSIAEGIEAIAKQIRQLADHSSNSQKNLVDKDDRLRRSAVLGGDCHISQEPGK